MIENIKGSKCNCGRISIPPAISCSLCNTEPEVFDIGSNGTILSYTRLHVTSRGFEAPLVIALVELDDGYRIMCNADPDSEYNIGDKVKVVLKESRLYIEN